MWPRLLIFWTVVSVLAAQEARLFWSMETGSLDLGAVYVLDGDPDVWLEDPSQAVVSEHEEFFEIGAVAADITDSNIVYVHSTFAIDSIDIYNLDDSTTDYNFDVSDNVKHMTLDWVNKLIYYTELNRIASWSYPNDNTVIFLENLNGPHGIDVDPIARFLFWSEPERGVIRRVTLLGADQQTVVYGLDNPRQITVEPDTQTLFWINDRDNSIEMSDYQGLDRTMVVEAGSISFIAMDVYRDFLLLATDMGTNLQVRHFNGTLKTVIIIRDPDGNEITDYEQRGLYMASRQTQPIGTPITREELAATNNMSFLILGYVLGPLAVVAIIIVVVVVCLKKKRNRNPTAAPTAAQPSMGNANPAIPMSPVQNNPYTGAPGQPVMQSPPQILARPQVFGQPNVMMQPQAQPHQFYPQPQMQMPPNVMAQPYPQVNPLPQTTPDTYERLSRDSGAYDYIRDSMVVDPDPIKPEPPKSRPEPKP